MGLVDVSCASMGILDLRRITMANDHLYEALTGRKSPDLYKEQEVDKNGGVLVLRPVGVSLHIPEGALDKTTLLSIEVVDTEEQGHGLAKTRIFTPTVACKPAGQKFNKPVELILPHCAVFDDFSFYKANVQSVDGNISIVNGNEVAGDAVYKVEERVCHIYTTHFSNFSVSIRDAVKKRMGVMPFTGFLDENSLSWRVWFLNDLPSEYILLRRIEKAKGLSSFDISGKIILHEQRYHLEAEAKSGKDSDNLFWINKVELNSSLLFMKSRCETFQTTLSGTSAYPRECTIRVLRENRTKPVLILRKYDEQNIGEESIVEELTECFEKMSKCLLEWELDDVPKGPFFDDDTINNLQNIAEEVEKNRLKKNIGVIGGSSTSIVGGAMSIIGGSLLLTPITVVAGAALLGIGIGLGVAGSSVTLGFSLDKTVRDKLRKDEIKDCLNEFVNIQSNVVSSVANIFETMDAIKGFKDIDKAKFTEVERVMLKKLQKMITEHEAGWNVDFITLPEILKKLHCQSKKLVEYLKHIEAMTGTQLLEMKKTALQTTCSHKNSLSSYRAQENAVETFVGFARRYLKLDDIDLQDTSAAGAKEGLEAGNASFSTAGMATKIAFPANDVAALGGNALKIANGFTAAGIVLGAVGLVVDAGFLGYAIYDLLKSDNEKFTQGLLEVIDLMEQMNRIDMRSKNEN